MILVLTLLLPLKGYGIKLQNYETGVYLKFKGVCHAWIPWQWEMYVLFVVFCLFIIIFIWEVLFCCNACFRTYIYEACWCMNRESQKSQFQYNKLNLMNFQYLISSSFTLIEPPSISSRLLHHHGECSQVYIIVEYNNTYIYQKQTRRAIFINSFSSSFLQAVILFGKSRMDVHIFLMKGYFQ